MERLKLQKKIFNILRKEILELKIRDWGHTAMIDHIAELAVRICEQISEDDYEEEL